jgi:hypothetical protein
MTGRGKAVLGGWEQRHRVVALLRRKKYERWLAETAPDPTDEEVAEVNRTLGPIPRATRDKPSE